jgi:hypothetical protein
MPNGVEVVVQIVISKANVAALANIGDVLMSSSMASAYRYGLRMRSFRSLGEIERTFFYWRQSF